MTDQGSEGVLSPYLRNKRFAATIPHIRGRVLDFGCGTGQLASFISSEKYYGVDVDEFSLEQARSKFPNHIFSNGLPPETEKFESIISMAVIEHVADPVDYLQTLSAYMGQSENSQNSQIILTTPHPSMDMIHTLGAVVGLFSKHASDEHEELLDLTKLENLGHRTGMRIFKYQRFCFGANQLIIFRKK